MNSIAEEECRTNSYYKHFFFQLHLYGSTLFGTLRNRMKLSEHSAVCNWFPENKKLCSTHTKTLEKNFNPIYSFYWIFTFSNPNVRKTCNSKKYFIFLQPPSNQMYRTYDYFTHNKKEKQYYKPNAI